SVASILANIGLAYISLNNLVKAFEYIEEAHIIFVKSLGNEHAKTRLIEQHFIRVCFMLGNSYFLNNQRETAQIYYQKLGFNIMDPILHKKFIAVAYQQNNLLKAIEHSKILTIIIPSDALNWQNLGCLYHIQAKLALEKNNIEEGQVQLQDAEGCFAQGIALNENSAIQIEYANFLLMNNQAQYAKEHLIRSLALKEDGKSLSYGKIEKPTVNPELQQEIAVNGEISSQAYLFAYYYLIRYHKTLDVSKIELEKYLGEFKREVAEQDTPLCYNLLGYCYKALDRNLEAKKWFSKALEKNPNARQYNSNSESLCDMGSVRSVR
ncbi:MAG: tetratricopeptide repeat protein, partial [Burkholderiales bacterium]